MRTRAVQKRAYIVTARSAEKLEDDHAYDVLAPRGLQCRQRLIARSSIQFLYSTCPRHDPANVCFEMSGQQWVTSETQNGAKTWF